MKSSESIKTDLRELKDEVRLANEINTVHGERIDKHESEITKLNAESENMRRRLNQLEQEKYVTHMDITGIPNALFTEQMKGIDLAMKVLNDFKIKTQANAIIFAYVRTIYSTQKKILTVAFRSLEEKLKAMKEKRAVADHKNIYFDHYMTGETRKLFMATRKLAKEKLNATAAFLWSKVFVIFSDGKKKLISSEAELEKLSETNPNQPSAREEKENSFTAMD
jgi:uncharacterized protein (DUF3084 family)